MKHLMLALIMLASPLSFAQQQPESASGSQPDVKPAAMAAPEGGAPDIPTAALQPALPPVPDSILLREGTPVHLKFAQKVSSKTAAVDDPVNFVLAEDLVADGIVIAKAGAVASGTGSHAQRAGMMGKGGELNIRLEHLKYADTKIRLRGTQGRYYRCAGIAAQREPKHPISSQCSAMRLASRSTPQHQRRRKPCSTEFAS